MSYPLLFNPLEIKSLTVKNRIVMPAMGTNLSDERGNLTSRALAYYVARAKGGTGLITTEAIPVNLTGKHRAGCLCIFDASHLEGLRRLTDAIHEAGSKAAIQLHHAGRLVNPQISGRRPASASEIPVREGAPVPKAMTPAEVKETISDFALAAQRAVQVGFDVIEIHGAHGYLINQFFSPRANQRTDEYGGTLENRMRFPLEVTEAVREAVGDGFPLLYRLSALEYEEGGYELSDSLTLGRKLKAAGVDILHVSAGTTESPRSALYTVQPQVMPEACLADFAETFKREVGMPVMGVGRISQAQTAEGLLKENKVDLVGMGRSLLADPEWPNKAKEGNGRPVRLCLACNRCLDAVLNQEPIQCAVNPLTGREEQLPLKRQSETKKIIVVGAGPAGLEAACTAAGWGHKVSLFEREGRIGGQLRSAAVPPHKALLETIIEYYDAQLPRLGVKLNLKEEFTEQTLEREDPDVLMVATGGRPMIPSLPGIDQPNVVTAYDVLMGSAGVGGQVLVVGGGLVGSETAEYLAERGKKVTLIEELEEVALDVEARSRPLLLERLARLGVEILTRCKLLSIEGAEARVQHGEQDRSLQADSIVLAVGTEPNNDLEAKLPSGRWKIMTLGDCRTPGNIKEAIHQGFWETYKALEENT